MEAEMSNYYNRFDTDPLEGFTIETASTSLRAAIEAGERLNKSCRELAERIAQSEKVTLFDVGAANGTREDALHFAEKLKQFGCEAFVQDIKVIAFGDAFKKAIEREVLKPIPIPIPEPDPKIEMWIWKCHAWR
jgi:hypothetical protein